MLGSKVNFLQRASSSVLGFSKEASLLATPLVFDFSFSVTSATTSGCFFSDALRLLLAVKQSQMWQQSEKVFYFLLPFWELVANDIEDNVQSTVVLRVEQRDLCMFSNVVKNDLTNWILSWLR